MYIVERFEKFNSFNHKIAMHYFDNYPYFIINEIDMDKNEVVLQEKPLNNDNKIIRVRVPFHYYDMNEDELDLNIENLQI